MSEPFDCWILEPNKRRGQWTRWVMDEINGQKINQDRMRVIDYKEYEHKCEVAQIWFERYNTAIAALKKFDNTFNDFDPDDKDSRFKMRQVIIEARTIITDSHNGTQRKDET